MLMKEVLDKYNEDVKQLKKRAKDLNLTDQKIKELLDKCLSTIELSTPSSNNNNFNRNGTSSNNNRNQRKAQSFLMILFKLLACLSIALIACYIILNVHQATSSIVLRNVQGLIYPGLKIIRFLSVPIIKKCPSLTRLYDESCLLDNPYFYVSDMECWPCQHVYSVIDITDFKNHSLYMSGIPYIVKTNQSKISYEAIQEMYKSNKEIFDNDANTITSNNRDFNEAQDIMNYFPNASKSSNIHISWRINRMTPARIVRKLFPRPYILSEWSGQSIERYIMIDEPKAPAHPLPKFECSYTFIVQGSGQQTIILKSTRECEHLCKTVSVVLKPSFVLWYNWWYWRPISHPMKNGTEVSISYINSYC